MTMNNIQNIGNRIIEHFFPDFKENIDRIWKGCPCQTIWQIISKEDGEVISQQAAHNFLAQEIDVYVLPEFLPALYMGVTPAYKTICSTSLLDPNGLDRKILNVDPLYVVSCDFSWMLALTLENGARREQLCILIKR